MFTGSSREVYGYSREVEGTVRAFVTFPHRLKNAVGLWETNALKGAGIFLNPLTEKDCAKYYFVF
jgi:hypothetical protein